MEKTKKISAKKIILAIISVILALILVLGIIIGIVWRNEISAVMSFKKVRDRNDAHSDGAVYMMTVNGGFYLDEYVAQGGVSNDDDLINFISSNITKGVVDISVDVPEISCSSFTAETKEGDRIFGRNYDMSKTNTCIVYTKGVNGRHSTISTVDLQFLGMDCDSDVTGLMNKVTCLAATYAPLDGINDAGVSCGIYMTYQGDETVATNQMTDKPDFTSTTMLRMILDYADSVEEAVEIASAYDLHDSANTSYHYMVADSTGKSAILEWVDGTDLTDNDGSARKLVVTYNDSDDNIGQREAESDYQWITNFIILPGYYEDDSAKHGYDRYGKIYEELKSRDGVVEDEADGMKILASVGRRDWNNDDDNALTIHSVVYNLTDKTVLWVSNENYDDETAIFELSFEK